MSFTTRLVSLWHRILGLPRSYRIGAVLAFVVIVFLSVQLFTRPATPSGATVSSAAHVQVATIADLASTMGSLPVTGVVTSVNEATLLAQTSGEITSLSYSLGDWVSAGARIATFENSSQRAAVLQATGAYDAAVAAAGKAGGSATENARSAVYAALASATAALDDAVHVRADQLFTNARTSSPELVLTVPDSALVAALKSERVSMETTLAEAHALAADTSANPDAASDTMSAYLRDTRAFLDDLVKAVNETGASQGISATTLAGYQTSLSAARTEIIGAISGVAAAKSAYDGNNVAAADANVKQAAGALAAAEAALAKTVVVSSISGTIVSLPVTRGDYVSAFSPIAIISNPHALYVDAYVTSDDARSLAVGGTALVNATIAGTITFVAPAVNPATGKIEVKIGLPAGAGTLATGEVVNVALSRSRNVVTQNAVLTLPIVAIKMTPLGPVVFQVSTSSVLTAHPITLGSILGSRVVVTGDLTPDVSIVTDARGLSDGETVVVDATL